MSEVCRHCGREIAWRVVANPSIGGEWVHFDVVPGVRWSRACGWAEPLEGRQEATGADLRAEQGADAPEVHCDPAVDPDAFGEVGQQLLSPHAARASLPRRERREVSEVEVEGDRL